MTTDAHWFTLVFVTALAASTLLRLWLAARQIRHVGSQRDTVPPAFSAGISLDAHARAADYTIAKTRLDVVDIAVSALIVLALTLGGGFDAITVFWSRWFESGGYAHGIALIGSVGLISAAVGLPLSLYRTFVIETRFGFNRISPGLFLADRIKVLLVSVVLGLPLLLVVLMLMAHMGPLWWLYVWLAWFGFRMLLEMAFPTLLAPLFNKFVPLQDDELMQRIAKLLEHCGFRVRSVVVKDGSKRSSHGNAYFTGFGAAKRIVLFDTLLARLAPQEIEAVVAHELGHVRHHHLKKRLAWSFGSSLAFLALLGWLISQPWFYAGLGVSHPSTGMALLLFFLAMPVFLFPFQWISSQYSRRHEYEADVFAATHTSAEDLVRALVKLYEDNASTLTPDPLHSAFYDQHPPAALRVSRLRSLRAEPVAEAV